MYQFVNTCIYLWIYTCKLYNYVHSTQCPDILYMCVYIYERHCNKCTNNNGSPEDEYHFVIVYNAYHDLRTQYISTYYYRRPYVYKCIELFTTNNSITLKKLGLFLIKVLNAEMQLWIIKPSVVLFWHVRVCCCFFS